MSYEVGNKKRRGERQKEKEREIEGGGGVESDVLALKNNLDRPKLCRGLFGGFILGKQTSCE
jgi:hypothetical protein